MNKGSRDAKLIVCMKNCMLTRLLVMVTHRCVLFDKTTVHRRSETGWMADETGKWKPPNWTWWVLLTNAWHYFVIVVHLSLDVPYHIAPIVSVPLLTMSGAPIRSSLQVSWCRSVIHLERAHFSRANHLSLLLHIGQSTWRLQCTHSHTNLKNQKKPFNTHNPRRSSLEIAWDWWGTLRRVILPSAFPYGPWLGLNFWSIGVRHIQTK